MSTPRSLPLATAAQVRQEVHRAARGVRGYFIGAIVVITAASLLDLAVPVATGWIIDAAKAHRPTSALLTPALVMAAAVIGRGPVTVPHSPSRRPSSRPSSPGCGNP